MGAIVCVVGERGDPGVAAALDRALARSPYRGEATRVVRNGTAMGVQDLGGDAVIGAWGPVTVAMTGMLPARSGDEGEENPAVTFARRWGEMADAAFDQLEGELAVVVHDSRQQEVVASRTVAFGRPLFVGTRGGRWLLASELGQVLTGLELPWRVDPEGVARYVLAAPGAGRRTTVAGVERVLPGEMWRLSLAAAPGEPRRTPWWSAPPVARGWTRRRAAEAVRDAIDHAVLGRLPEGGCAVTLSGGLDSTAVWASAAAHAAAESRAAAAVAITNAFPGMECDETGLVRAVLRHTGGRGLERDATGFEPLTASRRLAEWVDQPCEPQLANFVGLFERVRARGLRVVLTGVGGDEWFTGTPLWVGEALWRGRLDRFAMGKLELMRSQGLWRGAGRAARLVARAVWPRQAPRVPLWVAPELREQLSADGEGTGRGDRGMRLSVLAATRASVALENLEQLAARGGAEVRHPLLGRWVTELALEMPGWVLGGAGRSKELLRRAGRGRLPREVVERRDVSVLSSYTDPAARVLARRELTREWLLADARVVDEGRFRRLLERVAGDGSAGDRLTLWYLWGAEVCLRRWAEAGGESR